MMMRSRLLMILSGGLVLAGCASTSHSPAAGGVSPTPATTPYSLYTHCGIIDARIDGKWYQAAPPLSDGSGNPPAGWGNPYQEGVIRKVSATEVNFTDTKGHNVRFVLHPKITGPQQICS
jgi:hypothetical protein